MKIIRFGTVSVNENGGFNVTGFCFARENNEQDIDINGSKNAEYLIRVVANTLLNAVSPELNETNFTVERIVADAIRKAQMSKNG
ncbi:hypothetical protein [Phytobacter diazotrophicus]|uniref:hypothetical protein n=1 Tax=Phytobacter diazotrophicus TaxID=395631 RepID=UPI002FFD02FD